MKRALTLFTLTLVLAACSTAKPPKVDPATDPTIIGTLNDAVVQSDAEAAAGAEVGLRVGRVAGVLAAVFGGPQTESIDQTIDRYRRTRDAAVVTGALIGGAHGAKAGAQRGFEVDQRFAQLHELKAVTVLRPYPDQIDAYLDDTLAAKDVAAVFAGRPGWIIDIEGAGDAALDVRELLLGAGLPGSSLSEHRNNRAKQVVLHIQYLG